MKMNEETFALRPLTETLFLLAPIFYGLVMGLCPTETRRRNAYKKGLFLQQVHGVFSNHQLLVGRNNAYRNL